MTAAIPNTAPDRAELLACAARLAPVLRSRAPEAEKLRRVPDATIADLVDSRIPRMCQPARFGGSELGWDALCETSIALAAGDGSQAWVGNIYAEHAYIAALFADEAQHEVWDTAPDALISASVIPQGNRVEKVSGGYRLSGKWPFASGVHHARWLVLGEGEAGARPGGHLYFLVPQSSCRIDDDWHTIGMVGTGSASIVLDDVLVPAHRAIANADVAAGRAPGAAVNPAPLYRMPLMGFAQLALAAIPIGAAAGMVEDFKDHLRRRPASGAEMLHGRLSEAAAETRAATLLLLDAARANMERLAAGAALDEGDAARSMRDGGYAVMMARRAAGRLFEATGGHGLYLSQPLQRAFRDVHAAAAHGSLNWERSALRYAQHALQQRPAS